MEIVKRTLNPEDVQICVGFPHFYDAHQFRIDYEPNGEISIYHGKEWIVIHGVLNEDTTFAQRLS